jgi:hypothetical protein
MGSAPHVYGGGPTMIWSITMAAAALVRTAIHG